MPSLSTLGYLAGWKFVKLLPYPVAAAGFRFAADIVSKKGAGMDQLRRNLGRVVGPENVTRELVRDAVRSYARYWLEAFRLEKMASDPQFRAEVSAGATGWEHVHASWARGKGVILVAPHSGNWDAAGVYMVGQLGEFGTVVERLKPEEVYQAFVRYRESLGMRVTPHKGGTTHPLDVMARHLEAGGVVCLLGERDLKGNGVTVSFFGEDTTMPTGAVRLALRTGAAVHVAHPWYGEPTNTGWRRRWDGGWRVDMSEEIPVTTVAETTQAIADQMAENIALSPKDWHVLQPVWLADR